VTPDECAMLTEDVFIVADRAHDGGCAPDAGERKNAVFV